MRKDDDGAGESEPYVTPRKAGGARGLLVRLGVVVAVLATAGGAVWGLAVVSAPEQSPTTMEIPALSVEAADVEPGSTAPINATIKGDASKQQKKQKPSNRSQSKKAGGELSSWATRAGQRIGVHPRALLAYGRAEISTRQSHPSCKLSWATLAGIGRVESNHGQYGGAVLGEDGMPSKPIIGVPLDGSGGFKSIGDTDGGRFDGDKKVDRAVGPMQFIPGTWIRHAADGNGDGKADPQQIDDAALAAGNYLCAGGRDMATAKGWWSGLWSYNQSVEYGQKVFGLADQYAKTLNSRQ